MSSITGAIAAAIEELPKKMLLYTTLVLMFVTGGLTNEVWSLRADRIDKLERANDSAERKERTDILNALADVAAKNKQQDERLMELQKDNQSSQDRFTTRMDTAIAQLAAMRAQLDMLSRREVK